MKKTIAAVLCVLLAIASLPCAALADGAPRFVTIREWLDAEGECGECLLLVKIGEVVNPVLAVAIDDTGSVNLFSGGETDVTLWFTSEDVFLESYWLVIRNPRYNVFEGAVEMADWELLRMLPPYPSAGAQRLDASSGDTELRRGFR